MSNAVVIECYTYTRTISNGAYSGWDTEVTTLHNSNSRIARVINAKCSISENCAGEMSFTLLPDHPEYNTIKIRRSEILLKIRDVPVFCGYVEKVSDNFYKQRTITCRGVLDYLKDSILRVNRYLCNKNNGRSNMYNLLYGEQIGTVGSSEYSGAGWIRQHNELMGDCLWKYFRITTNTLHESTSNSGSKFQTLASYITDNETTYSAIENKLLKDSGMLIRVQLYVENNSIVKTLHFYSGEDAIVESSNTIKTIAYGKNLIDYSAAINGSDVASNIYPFGVRQDGDLEEVQDRLSIKSVNNNVDYIENDNAVTNYGRIYTVKDWDDFTNVSQASSLKEVAKTEIQSRSLRVDTLTITAVGLYSLTGNPEVTVIYDVLNIFSLIHNINNNLVCTKIDYDIDNPQNSRLHFGKTKKNLSSIINNLRR